MTFQAKFSFYQLRKTYNYDTSPVPAWVPNKTWAQFEVTKVDTRKFAKALNAGLGGATNPGNSTLAYAFLVSNAVYFVAAEGDWGVGWNVAAETNPSQYYSAGIITGLADTMAALYWPSFVSEPDRIHLVQENIFPIAASAVEKSIGLSNSTVPFNGNLFNIGLQGHYQSMLGIGQHPNFSSPPIQYNGVGGVFGAFVTFSDAYAILSGVLATAHGLYVEPAPYGPITFKDSGLRFKRRGDHIVFGNLRLFNIYPHALSVVPRRILTTHRLAHDVTASYLVGRVVDTCNEDGSVARLYCEDTDFQQWPHGVKVVEMSKVRPTKFVFKNCRFWSYAESFDAGYDTGYGAFRMMEFIGCREGLEVGDSRRYRLESNMFLLTREFSVVRNAYPSKVGGVPYSNHVKTPAYLVHYWETARLHDVELDLPNIGSWGVELYVLSKTPLTNADFWADVVFTSGGEIHRKYMDPSTGVTSMVEAGLGYAEETPTIYPTGQGSDWVNAPVGYQAYRMEVLITTRVESSINITLHVGGPNLDIYYDPTPDLVRY